MGKTYKDAGVDIEAGESSVERIKTAVRSTYTKHVLSDVGHFGGFYSFPSHEYSDPVLVSSTDGIGTKLKLAFQTGIHDTVGQDLVNHCVNDILTSGALPLFFLDYIGIGKMDEEVVSGLVDGIALACKENGCALIGGELAEMSDIYQPGEYDVAGTIVGCVEREEIINGNTIRKDDVPIGLRSTGLHTNGFTPARKVLLEQYGVDSHIESLGKTIGEQLLAVHKSYLHEIKPLIGDSRVKGLAHITGGGLLGNVKRILPPDVELKVDWEAWEIPPIFRLIQEVGEIQDHEMRRTFNCGIGFVVIVSPENAADITEHFEKYECHPVPLGQITEKS